MAAALTSRGASKDLQATSAIAGRKWMLLLACLPAFYNLLYLSGALWLDFLPFLDSLCSLTAILLHVMLRYLPCRCEPHLGTHVSQALDTVTPQPSTATNFTAALNKQFQDRASAPQPPSMARARPNEETRTSEDNRSMRPKMDMHISAPIQPVRTMDLFVCNSLQLYLSHPGLPFQTVVPACPTFEMRGPRSEVQDPRSEVRGARREV